MAWAGDLNGTGIVLWQETEALTGTRLIRRLRQSPHLSDEDIILFFDAFQLDLETGVGLNSGQGSDPQLMLRWSDTRGHTWGQEHWVSAGRLGAHRWRALWRRLGRSRDRVWQVVVTDACRWTIIDGIVTVRKGTA